jgi:hypothetical protein
MVRASGPPPPCGTIRAFYRHRRRSETVDDACRKAIRLAQREWKQRRAASSAGVPAEIRRTPREAVVVGALVGTDEPHAHVPDGDTGTLCVSCFGWCNDPRHAGQAALPAVAS